MALIPRPRPLSERRPCHDWERAVTFERQGGFAAFDFVGPNPAYRYVDEEGRPTVDELNKGAFSYRRMKLALGHLEVTSRPMREW